MKIVSHSKCKKCDSAKNITELKEEPESNNLVCKDTGACEKTRAKKMQATPLSSSLPQGAIK